MDENENENEKKQKREEKKVPNGRESTEQQGLKRSVQYNSVSKTFYRINQTNSNGRGLLLTNKIHLL